jgi:hypothetical protein
MWTGYREVCGLALGSYVDWLYGGEWTGYREVSGLAIGRYVDSRDFS